MQCDDCGSPSSETTKSRVALIVPKRLVKKTKDALEAHGYLDKSVKIRPTTLEDLETSFERVSTEPRPDDTVFIPTKLFATVGQADSSTSLSRRALLEPLGLGECEKDISIATLKYFERGCNDDSNSHEASKSKISSVNPLARTVGQWLHRLPLIQFNGSFASEAVLCYSWTYMIYPPLLLLPSAILTNLTSVLASKGQGIPPDLSPLWSLLSKEFKASHIALNAPIPASASEGVPGRPLTANILRSPTGLVPLYGDFGPALPLSHIPTVTDFSLAFWCTARQNNIFQTWAPRYTMFSRGNISEKARILNLQTLTEKHLGTQLEKTCAVDLYAGIGYFAFSYVKAGIGKVLCWEINPWSIEGLRRGAKRNGWGVKVINEGHTFNETIGDGERLFIFQENNVNAAGSIAALRNSIFPVRHVNCGLLPSSKSSWEIAVQALDPMGGWIHAHENIAKADVDTRKEEVVTIFAQLVNKYYGQRLQSQQEVKCEHVERVKSYAPGIVHCVLDISILP